MTFQPEVSLLKEKDGTYTLHSIMLVPNTSYRAIRPELGLPAGMVVAPDVIPVLLPVISTGAPALMVIRAVMHELRNIVPSEGKRQIVAFAMHGGQVAAQAAIGFEVCQDLARTPVDIRSPDDDVKPGDDPGDFPFPLRNVVGFGRPPGHPEAHALGKLLEAHLPFLHGTSVAPYLKVEEHPLRGLERCNHCGTSANMGTFTLKEARGEMTLPYLAVHALADHGTVTYAGEIHQGKVDTALLSSMLHVRQRTVGQALESWLWSDALPPPHLTITKHVMKGLETCTLCGTTANMGTFDLNHKRTGQAISLPFVASHTLATHGDEEYKGTLHTGKVDFTLLEAVVRPFESRERM